MSTKIQLTEDEFCVPFKSEFNPRLSMETIYKMRGEEWEGGGTCQLENSILYAYRQTDPTITRLQFRHFIIERNTDKKHINHYALIYFQNGNLFVESKANGIHKKLLLKTYATHNKIIKNENSDMNYQVNIKNE